MWTLVTGAGGFVGGHVTRHLFECGIPVVALQRTPRGIDGVPDEDGANFRRLIGDLTAPIALDVPIENIVHLAARIKTANSTSEAFEAGNVATASGVVRLAKATNSTRVIALSTISVYGRPAGATVLTEKTPITETDAYGMSKHRAELTLKELTDQAQVTTLRMPGILGRHANPNLVVGMCEKAARNEAIRITNPDALFNSTVHVSDVCRLIERLLVAQPARGYNVVNVSSAKPLSIRALAENIINGLGSASKITVDAGGEPPCLIDAERLRDRFGYEAMSVSKAIALYASEYRPK